MYIHNMDIQRVEQHDHEALIAQISVLIIADSSKYEEGSVQETGTCKDYALTWLFHL